MRPFLDEYITSLNTGNQRRASAILENAKIEKSQLGALVERLLGSDMLVNIALTQQEPDTLINGSPIRRNFRDVDVNMKELYRLSNDISLLLDSHAQILTSDISALEKEIDALEKSVSNYAFLLSDAKAYDYAYLETFSDSRGEDEVEWAIPDRGRLVFDPTEKAYVNTAEGVLALTETLHHSYPMTAQIVNSNVLGYTTSNTGIGNAVNGKKNKGWRLSVSTPAPINATLPDYVAMHGKSTWAGALVVVECTLSQPSPCDTIQIQSFADSSFEVVQARIYTSLSTNDYSQVLEDPIEINGTKNLFFPMQSVARVRLYLRQEAYKRTAAKPIDSEEQHKNVYDNVSLRDRNRRKQENLQRMNILLKAKNTNKKVRNFYTPNIPKDDWEQRLGAYTIEELISTLRQDRAGSTPWTNSTQAARAMERLIRNSLHRNNAYIFADLPSKLNLSFYDSIIRSDNLAKGSNLTPTTPAIASNPVQNQTDLESSTEFRYDYNFGISSLSIGAGVQGFKGVFISRKMPAPGDIGELRLRAEDVNYVIQDTDRDSGVVTSVEYSVTNKSVPINEEDWIPVLPVGNITVRAERALPDSMGRVTLRFPASLDGDIKLYKNGYLTTYNPNGMFIYGPGSQTITGLKIPITEFTSQDIFTVDYTPSGDRSVVNFEAAGFFTPPLVSSYDEDGAGEGFSGTNGQLQISLTYIPYFHASYPVTIRLDDGTIVQNLVNYSGGTSTALDPNSEDYQFIHSGNTIIFNKAITQGFRVYYQYFPSNVRVRIVLRSNDRSFVSPKVDAFQLKAKTRQASASQM